MLKHMYKKVNHLYDMAVNYWNNHPASFKDEIIDGYILDLETLCFQFLECNSPFFIYVYRKMIQIQLETGREVEDYAITNYYRDSYIFKQRTK